MRILYLAHRIPYPPDKGDKLRAFRQIEHLSRRHEVWCACFVDRAEDEVHADTLRQWCRRVHAIRLNRIAAPARGMRGLVRGGSLTESYFAHGAMQTALEAWACEMHFDAVVAFSSGMAGYALRLPAGRRMLDLCDLDSLKWRDYAERVGGAKRILYALEARRLGRRERAWISAFDATTIISHAEARYVPPDLRERVTVVGNGVDCEAGNAESESRHPVEPVVGFVGVMDYPPNVDAVRWFVRECWPRIRKSHECARFRVVGHRPTRAIRSLAGVSGIEIVGRVPNVRQEIRRFAVSVAPLRIARGVQNKVLEAMAEGTPVVLTPCAAEGIDAVHGRDYLVAGGTEDIAASVCRLLADSETGRRVGESGRKFVSARFRWDVELSRFEELVTGSNVDDGIARGFGIREHSAPCEKAAGEPAWTPAAAEY